MTGYKILPFLFFFVLGAHAQQKSIDSSLVSSGEEYARKLYLSQRGELIPIYNGAQHFPYSQAIEGVPYFPGGEWQNGTVWYDNVLYENVLMKYDLVKDQLIVTSHSGQGLAITLFGPRVKSFSFSGMKFIRLDKSLSKNSLPEGYYQQLTEGKLTVLAKREKKIDQRIVSGVNNEKFVDNVSYFIVKDGMAYPIDGKKDLMRLVKDKENEVKEFMSKEKLRYRKQTELTIVSVANYYSQISH